MHDLTIYARLNSSFVMYITAYKKWKKYHLLNVWRPVLDMFLYTVLMCFDRTVAHLLMPKRSENVGKRIETAPL